MYNIRFNLGRGKGYMKWKIIDSEKQIKIVDPNRVCLVMTNCVLHNNKNSANKIFNGANKQVCAHIICDTLEIIDPINHRPCGVEKISYNPRIKPYWVDNNDIDIDNKKIGKIISHGKNLYQYVLTSQ